MGRRASHSQPGRGRALSRAVDSAAILETAAVVSHLDLIVTVDTMVAHLAGALRPAGVDTAPFEADWRWTLGRTDSPWFPTLRLLRQPDPDAWGSRMGRVAAEPALMGAQPSTRTRHAAP
jgi:hypothetical protein